MVRALMILLYILKWDIKNKREEKKIKHYDKYVYNHKHIN